MREYICKSLNLGTLPRIEMLKSNDTTALRKEKLLMAESKKQRNSFLCHRRRTKLIRRKMIESKTKNMGAYLRKMAMTATSSTDIQLL